jgi:hypothetical protein
MHQPLFTIAKRSYAESVPAASTAQKQFIELVRGRKKAKPDTKADTLDWMNP